MVIYVKKIKNVFAIFIIICTLTMTGCTKEDNNKKELKRKVGEELNYLDTHIISLINDLNNISLENYKVSSERVEMQEESQKLSTGSVGGEEKTTTQKEGQQSSGQSESGKNSESNINTTKMEPNAILASNKEEIDWERIKYEIESLNEAWTVILLDLYSLNVNNDDVVAFSTAIDSTIVSIKNENKQDTLTNLANLYSYIPIYEKGISAENNIQNVKQTKSFLINAYSVVEQGNWYEVQTNINECEKTFKNVVNDIEFASKNEYKVNKTYVLIKELQNSLDLQDKEVFYIKYKSLLESVNTL